MTTRQIPGIMGTSVSQPQWESGNASVRFPFADDAGPADYPYDAIVDACIVVPHEGAPSGETVCIGCLHIGPGMVSVMVYADDDPILSCNVTFARFEPFSPVVMTPVRPGCSGIISFGDISRLVSHPVTVRTRVRLADSAVVRPVVGRLRRFVQPERGEEATGVVGIEVPDGVGISMSEDGHTSTMLFSLSDNAKETVMIRCNPAESIATMPVPISSINGVHPDDSGRLAIVFAHDLKEVPA